MKNSLLSGGIWIAVLLLILTPSCTEDEIILPVEDPTQVAIPAEEEANLYGIRLVLEGLECIKSSDASGNSEELYGWLTVHVNYLAGYTKTAEQYEKEGTALLWYATPLNDHSTAEGSTWPLNRVMDYYFNPASIHRASIQLSGHMKEEDSSSPDDDFGYNELSLNVEQIIAGATYELSFEGHGGSAQVRFNFRFERIRMRSSGILPDNYQPSDLFEDIGLYPDLPKPESYAAQSPAISERLIVGQKPWNNFHPDPTQVWKSTGQGPYFAYCLRNIGGAGITYVSGGEPAYPQVIPDQNNTDRQWYGLLDGTPYTGAPYEVFSAMGPTQLMPLEKAPRLQLIRFYKPIEIWRLPAGSSWEKTVSYSNKWEKEYYVEFSLTVGIDISLFSTELSSTFGSAWSYSGTVSESETMSYNAPADKDVLYIVWQLYEEYRIVDEEGHLFTDPNYEFRSMEVITIPTDHIVPKAYMYDVNI
jgi:hypothetical protein